jgi:hypothetical protein
LVARQASPCRQQHDSCIARGKTADVRLEWQIARVQQFDETEA